LIDLQESKIINSFEIQGNIIGMRRIGNRIIVITSYKNSIGQEFMINKYEIDEDLAKLILE
jgi:hypothetical protein